MKKLDFLIIGSGIAGLSYALKLANKFPAAKLAIVTKANENESNTKYAQGGIAVVTDAQDSFEQHVTDTLVAGDGLCDLEVVKFVVSEAPDRLHELINWHVDFDKSNSGVMERGLEGGHTQHRVLHHKDKTGLEIEQKLLVEVAKSPHILVFKNHLAIDLVIDKHENETKRCWGAYVLNKSTGKVERFLAKQTMLSTGGLGHLYQNTTNPAIATGDGVAMAFRAGAKVADLEFIQFHPTAFYHPELKPAFLISEAVRGFGAHLRNHKGERFMQNLHPMAELAPRDIVARAIYFELQKSNEPCVYLDCTQVNIADFKNKFPMITNRMENLNIDLAKAFIPVVTAAHYACGGVSINMNGQTEIEGLFSTGECSHTGLHGANRLASNSLLEALVFSHSSFLTASENFESANDFPEIKPWQNKAEINVLNTNAIAEATAELQQIMNDCAGIIRNDKNLHYAKDALVNSRNIVAFAFAHDAITAELVELRNMIDVALLIIEASLNRVDNAGTFYKVATEDKTLQI